jgi:hypothetical protein
MAKTPNPLFSFGAVGSLAHRLTFRRSRQDVIAESLPTHQDAKTGPQLAHRVMFQMCKDLWHTLAEGEKLTWEAAAREHHMTGYAYYLSLCLKPNPGIYLPLAGGTMTGNIDMATKRILALPSPVANEEPSRKTDLATAIAALQSSIATRVTDFITPIAGEILRQSPTANSPFYAQIHDFPPGTLSSTVVPYRDPTNEGCLTGISAGAGYWGRIILRNTTLGGSRKIVSVDTANNLITTEPSVDSWADNDYINTHSEMVWENFFDVDVSAHIGTDVKAIALFGVHSDISGVNNASRTVFYHPHITYDDGLRLWIPCRLANDSNSLYLIMPVYDQRISMKYVALTNGITITAAKGVLK